MYKRGMMPMWLLRQSVKWPVALLVVALALAACPAICSWAQETTPPADLVGNIYVVSVYSQPASGLEPAKGPLGFWEKVVCTTQPGTGQVRFSKGEPDAAALQAARDAFASLATLRASGLFVPHAYSEKRDLTLSYPADVLSHQGAGHALAYAIAAYSALLNAPVLHGVTAVGAVSPEGKLGAVENVDVVAKAAADAGATTLILPADNSSQAAALPEEILSRLRVVLAPNLARAIFHALGPYGPWGVQYNQMLAYYNAGTSAMQQGNYAHAVQIFSYMASQVPEDVSVALLLHRARSQQAIILESQHFAAAEAKFDSGDLAGARYEAEAALAALATSERAQALLKQITEVFNDVVPPVVGLNVQSGQALPTAFVLTVRVTENLRLFRVSVLIDGQEVASSDFAPLIVTLDLSALSGGVHTLCAEATDLAGNKGAEEVTFTVARGTEAHSSASAGCVNNGPPY